MSKYTEADLKRAREVVPREFVFLVDEIAQAFADVRRERDDAIAVLLRKWRDRGSVESEFWDLITKLERGQ